MQRHGFDRYPALTVFNTPNVTQHTALGLRGTDSRREILIQRLEGIDQLRTLYITHRIQGHHRLDLDAIQFQLQTYLAGDDQQLPGHIHAGQVIPGIWLSKAQLHGFRHCRRQGYTILQQAEDHRQ